MSPEDRLQLGEIESELRELLEIESKKLRANQVEEPPLFRRPAIPGDSNARSINDGGSRPIKRAQQG